MVRTLQFSRSIMTLFMMFFAMSTAVLAGGPGIPKEFKVIPDGEPVAPATLKFSWVAPSSDTNIQYVVYMASMTANGSTDFKAIIETRKTEAVLKDVPAGIHKFYVVARAGGAQSEPSVKLSVTVRGEIPNTFAIIIDPSTQTIQSGSPYKFQVKLQYPDSYKGGFEYKIERNPAGMTISDKGLIEWANPIVGTYVILVTSKMIDAPNSVAVREYKLIVTGGKTTFEIISKPKELACINKLYVYEAVAKVPVDGGIVTWSLFNKIDGMSIDEKTGRLTWTPTKEGVYNAKIKATFIKGNDTLITYQSWTIVVKTNCENTPTPPCSKIVGMLKDDNGNPILTGKVKAIRLEKDNGPSSYETFIRNGQWTLMVREGSYKIRFEGDGFNAEWFEDAIEMGNAKTIIAVCDKINEIVAKVTPKEKPILKAIEGMVKDSEGNPVPNAIVTIMMVEANGGSKDGMKVTVKTNDKGQYRIEVPVGLTFIAMAMPNEALAKTHSHVYYDGKQNANEATRFTVTNAIEINFTLPKKAVFNNGLAVSLKDTNGVGIKGRVTLLPVSPNGKEPKKGAGISMETDSLGNALLKNIQPGIYVLQGIPFTRSYAPGFYTSTGFAAMTWKEGTKIEVGEVMITLVYDVRLRPVLGKRGAARVDGIVKGRGSMLKSDSPLAEESLTGALIYAMDENNDIADYAMTDNAGTYAMVDLGQGTFTLMADMIDFEPSFGTVITDYVAALTVNSSITLGSTAMSADDRTISGDNVYPNPASSMITVNGLEFNGPAKMQIYSAMGIMISEFDIMIDGNTTSFDVNGLSSGSYMFRINGNQSQSSGQFIIAR
ncbi:MAG: T9SS type A sorting domain-containing protein [Candidatus Kapaibacteriota bacterium]